MAHPVGTIDTRFSYPGTPPFEWLETVKILEESDMFWVTTVRGDGRPHVVPLVAVWTEDALHFCTGENEQKAVNLTHNQHVVVTTGSNGWQDGVDVVVEGLATQVVDKPTLERLAAVWLTKWDGRWQYVAGEDCFHHPDDDSDPPTKVNVYTVTPSKIFCFSKGSFGQTRYRP
jgi:general stress protein 26